MHAKSLSLVPPSRGLVFALALCSGLGVANVYYLQPSLFLVQSEFHATASEVGIIPTLTQIGYAMGMLFLAPLGDIVERRQLILWKAALMIAALLLASVAPNVGILAAAGVFIGILGSIGQDYIPLAAHLSPEAERGRAVGTVTTGLLTGILLSRALGGWVGELLSWRAMQEISAVLMLVVAGITWWLLPEVPPTVKSRYGTLMASLWTLWRKHRSLRITVLTQSVLALSLGAFWSSLAIVLAGEPYHLGASAAGAYGFAGAAGALAAPWFGRFADKSSPLHAVRIGSGLVILAFAGLLAFEPSAWMLGFGALVFDLGVMAALVSHQTIINGIDPNARSRLNGMLMTGAMCGMAIGAALGSWALDLGGADGLWCVGGCAGIAGMAISFFHSKEKEK